jgi:hypothetical protein
MPSKRSGGAHVEEVRELDHVVDVTRDDPRRTGRARQEHALERPARRVEVDLAPDELAEPREQRARSGRGAPDDGQSVHVADLLVERGLAPRV